MFTVKVEYVKTSMLCIYDTCEMKNADKERAARHKNESYKHFFPHVEKHFLQKSRECKKRF